MVQPYDYAYTWLTTVRFRTLAIGCTALATCVGIGAIAAEKPWAKTLMFSSALALTCAARVAENGRITAERIGTDYTDLSDGARQQLTYTQLTAMQDGPMLALEGLEDESESDPIEWYDLTNLRSECHAAIIGSTGTGKTVLAQWLLRTNFDGIENIKVYDTDASPRDWKNLEVIGAGNEYHQIEGAMFTDLAELQKRTKRRASGFKQKDEIVRLVEEFPTLSNSIKDDLAKDQPNGAIQWMKELLRRGRKYKMMAILLSQNFEVKALGLEGEGSVREAFTIIYLGNSAINQLDQVRDKEHRAALRQILKEQKEQNDGRCCLVLAGGQYMPADVPDLSELAAELENFGDEPPPEDDPTPSTPTDPSPAPAAPAAETAQAAKSVGATLVIPDSDWQTLPDITLPSGKVISAYTQKFMRSQVATLTESDYSPSRIIKEAWGLKGRNYQEGKALWLALGFEDF